MILTNKKVFILYAILICTVSCAQNTYKGTITDWPHDYAEIILPTEDPIVIGEVNKKGKASLTLGEELAQRITEAKEQANTNGGGMTIRSQSVQRTFYCRDDDAVSVNNGDLVPEKVSARGAFYIGNLKDQAIHGQIRLTSSEAFNNSYFKLGKKDFVKGHYIEFFYMEDDASVKGTCETPTYTLDGKDIFNIIHEYDIDLKKGWNMVKIEVADTYTDQEGNVRPLRMIMKTVKEIPKDTQFIFSAE